MRNSSHQERQAFPVRFHIENNPDAPQLYHVTPEIFDAAIRGMPDLAGKVEGSFGCNQDKLGEALKNAEVLFIHGRLRVHNLGSLAPRLRWIQSTAAGVDKLLPLVPSHVILTSTRGIHAEKGGEYALTALLMLNHQVPRFVTAQRRKEWDQFFATPIAGKTVLVLGAGAIGTEVARLSRALGVRVLGISRSGKANPAFHACFASQQLHDILPQADFLLILLPLTQETEGLIGRREFDLLPAHAGVINLGRGAVIDNDALADKLRKGELSGAVLDVYPEEPLPRSSPLWCTPNLIMSPHCAIDDAEHYAQRALEVFLANLCRYLNGETLINLVDKVLGY